MTTPELRDGLILAARSAQRHAYAVYSNYQVGVGIQSASGEIYSGCNVENVSYGLTICAERVALFAAVAQGHREFKGLALVTPDGSPPCGACLQVLAEFCNDLPIWLVGAEHDGNIEEVQLHALLPRRFAGGPATGGAN